MDDAGHPLTAYEHVREAALALRVRFHVGATASVCRHFQIDWHSDHPDPAHHYVRVHAKRRSGYDRPFEHQVERLVYSVLGPWR